MGLFSSIIGGIFGGGSSASSTSSTNTKVTVDVDNVIDTAKLGEYIGAALIDTANIAAQVEQSQITAQASLADKQLEQQEQIATLNVLQTVELTATIKKAALLIVGSFLLLKVSKI